MTTTTYYGTWNNRADRHALIVAQSIANALGAEGARGYDLEAIESDYRATINAALESEEAV